MNVIRIEIRKQTEIDCHIEKLFNACQIALSGFS